MMLTLVSDQIKSCYHHVSIPQPGSKHETLSADGRYRVVPGRYSIPYFVYPDADSLIEVIKECTSVDRPAMFEPMLMRDFFNMRLEQIGYRFSDKSVHTDTETVPEENEKQEVASVVVAAA
jgi:isopenicillin N synthase-like dioxygenase